MPWWADLRHIPNALTIIRILLVPCILLLLGTPWGFRLFFFCGVSDLADGFLARRFNWQSKLGGYLDPIADKLMMSSLFIALALNGVFPAWLTYIVLGRDVAIALGGLILMQFTTLRDFPPTLAGKLSTFCQGMTLLAAMGGWTNRYFNYVTAAMAVASGLQYAWFRARELR